MLRPLMVGGRPHWEKRFPEVVWPAYEDFRNFLTLAWDHLGLPAPTPAQLEVAHRLQYGVDSVEFDALLAEYGGSAQSLLEALQYDKPHEDIIRAFRALGKSYITAAFVIWRLMRNPRDEKVLVVSATGAKAKEFVDQAKGIIESMPLVSWLLEGPRESGARRRDQADKFDVAGASLSQSYSLKAAGITGQTTGSRATCLVADDIEIPANSKTEDGRRNIINAVRSDFGPIRKTEHGMGDMLFLGTPQTEESVYNVLVKEMGYSCFCIPVRFPAADKLDNYLLKCEETGKTINILAYYLRAAHDNGELDHNRPTDTRFDDDELRRLESQGRAHFALQYMLDTSLSDAERYPLKQHDLIVFSANFRKAPLTVQWGRDSNSRNVLDVSNLGFSGDHFLGPLFVDDEWREYEGRAMFVDPSGRGADETAWAVAGQLGGMTYVLKVDGHSGDPAEAMRRIAADAKMFDVNNIEVEPNYAQGVWVTAFQPILAAVWPGGCTVEESEWAKGQKETRIIGTLEPAMTAHRIVFNEQVIREDVERAKTREFLQYSLMYQLTHITHERGALAHDDRLEAVAGVVQHFVNALAIDSAAAREGFMTQEKEELIESFIEDYSSGFKFGSGRRRGKDRGDGYRREVWQF